MKRPSEKTRRALRILDGHTYLVPSDFARLMWDVSGWERTAGMTGGSYLSLLEDKGLIDGNQCLTEEGRRVLGSRS